jgi:TetR/AcrR family transcriptional regulator, repressor of fatR-cypB operon
MFIPDRMAAQATLPNSDKRDAILAAAVELFAERGFFGTAVPDVASRAKVGAGTIYRYFPSKEALVNALYQHHKARMADAILGGIDFTQPARVVFHAFWQRICVFARQNQTAIQFLELQHHAPYLDDASRVVERQLLDMAKGFLEQGITQQVFRDVSPSLLVAIVWGAFRGLFQGGCDKTLTLDDATIAASEQCIWEAIRR